MEIPGNDPLTGLPTLGSIAKCFEQLVSDRVQFGMLLLDIDGFIFFNDRYGYQEADEQLKQIANLIGQTVPKNARVFRSGGDEFAVFLTGINMSEVVSVAMEVKDTIDRLFSSLPMFQNSYWFPDKSCLCVRSRFTISCGVTFYPVHGKSFADLREVAKAAMYRGGKNLRSGGVLVVAEFKR